MANDKFGAFTIKNLFSDDAAGPGLFEVLENNKIPANPPAGTFVPNRKIALGWFMKFNADQPAVPEDMTQLILEVNTDSGGNVTADFYEIEIITSINTSSPGAAASGANEYAKVKIEQIEDRLHESMVTEVSDTANRRIQYYTPHTKAVFFSRSELLLFKTLLKIPPSDSSERDILFSGYKMSTGRMGAIGNMAELEYLRSTMTDATTWFTLKAELWKKPPTGQTSTQTLEAVRDGALVIEAEVAQQASTGSSDSVAPQASPTSGRCESVHTAMYPIMTAGRPCPPGWIGHDSMLRDAILFAEGFLEGQMLLRFIEALACTLRDMTEEIGRTGTFDQKQFKIANKKDTHESL